jgi:AraC-like DNA-binding protein
MVSGETVRDYFAQAIIDDPRAPPGAPPIFDSHEPIEECPITTYPKEWLIPGWVPPPRKKPMYRVRLKKRAGRKAHKPTQTLRRRVELLANRGVPQEDIAKLVGISPKTLRLHYRDVLDTALARRRAFIVEAIMNLIKRDNTAATIFGYKTFLGRNGSDLSADRDTGEPHDRAPTRRIYLPWGGRVSLPRALMEPPPGSPPGTPPIKLETVRMTDLPMHCVPRQFLPPELKAVLDSLPAVPSKKE